VYELVFHPDAAKDLKNLDKSTRQRILARIEWLVDLSLTQLHHGDSPSS
jgi:mRNA-degrading endonuclease RelE of RelBE toxin-antitoxin system